MSISFDPNVTLTLEVGFASGPKDAAVTWTDISTDLRGFELRRGRDHELDTIRGGELTLLLDNRDRDYDPTYTASPYSPNVKPAKPVRLRAVYNTVTYDLFRGTIDGWPQLFPAGGKDAVVEVRCSDDFKLIAADDIVSNEVQEKSGVRIGNILDDASWPSGRRNLATGVMDVAATNAGACVNPLTEIQKVVDSELGLFFMAGDGKATFQDKNYRGGLTSKATFGGASGLPYVDVVVGYDDTQIWNLITTTRVGSEVAVEVSDATSITAYGRRKLRLNDLLLVNDTDLTTIANAYLSRYAEPGIRIERMTFWPQSDPAALWPEALAAEISDLYTVVVSPPGGGADISQDVHVEGISHTVTPKRWSVTWTLSPA